MNKVTTRQVICDTLLAAAKEDRNIIVACSDSRGSGSMTAFFEQFPAQSVEVGIAEQDLVSISAGLAACGKKVFAVSPACFLSTFPSYSFSFYSDRSHVVLSAKQLTSLLGFL